jgi:hypothetical protein
LNSQVQKSASHYTEAAVDEIKLLDQIRSGDPDNEKSCVRLYDSFTHLGPHGKHMCMVFEVRKALQGRNNMCVLRLFFVVVLLLRSCDDFL